MTRGQSRQIAIFSQTVVLEGHKRSRTVSAEAKYGGKLAGKENCIFFFALLFYVHGKHLRSCRDGQLS